MWKLTLVYLPRTHSLRVFGKQGNFSTMEMSKPINGITLSVGKVGVFRVFRNKSALRNA